MKRIVNGNAFEAMMNNFQSMDNAINGRIEELESEISYNQNAVSVLNSQVNSLIRSLG
jgi:hypothetical protein